MPAAGQSRYSMIRFDCFSRYRDSQCSTNYGGILIMKKIFLLGLAIVAMSASSQASVIISLTNVTANGANFDWNYGVVLSGDQNFRNFGATADQTEVFDFGGFVSASFIGNVLLTGNASVLTQA